MTKSFILKALYLVPGNALRSPLGVNVGRSSVLQVKHSVCGCLLVCVWESVCGLGGFEPGTIFVLYSIMSVSFRSESRVKQSVPWLCQQDAQTAPHKHRDRSTLSQTRCGSHPIRRQLHIKTRIFNQICFFSFKNRKNKNVIVIRNEVFHIVFFFISTAMITCFINPRGKWNITHAILADADGFREEISPVAVNVS